MLLRSDSGSSHRWGFPSPVPCSTPPNYVPNYLPNLHTQPHQFRNDELHRLMEVSPESGYRAMTTVLTSAMHGEKFRWVVWRGCCGRWRG